MSEQPSQPTIQIPDSVYAGGNTYVAPCVAPLAKISTIFSKKTEPETWVDDLLQVTSGAGSIAYSTVLPAEKQHSCPLCGSNATVKLVHVPNCAYYELEFSCRCGADYDGELVGLETYGPERTSLGLRTLRERHTPEVIAQHQRDFAYWLARAVPMGTRPIYDDHGSSLAGVELPDGQRVMR